MLKVIGIKTAVAVIIGSIFSIPAFAQEQKQSDDEEGVFEILRNNPDVMIKRDHEEWLSYYAAGARFKDMATHDRSRSGLPMHRNSKPDTALDRSRFHRSLHGIEGGGEGAILAWRHNTFAFEMWQGQNIRTLEFLTVALPTGLPATGEKIEIDSRDPATPLAYWTLDGGELACFSYADTGTIEITKRAKRQGSVLGLIVDVRLRFGDFSATEIYESRLAVKACEPFEFSKTVTFYVAPADFPDPWIPE